MFAHESLKWNGFILDMKIDPNLVNWIELYRTDLFDFFAWIERNVNPKLTKQIEEIEDALGNEVYFFSFTNDQKQINFPNDSNEEQM
jgi:hypothetical protein